MHYRTAGGKVSAQGCFNYVSLCTRRLGTRTWTKASKVHGFKWTMKKKRWNQSAKSISKSREARFTIDARSFIHEGRVVRAFVYVWMSIRGVTTFNGLTSTMHKGIPGCKEGCTNMNSLSFQILNTDFIRDYIHYWAVCFNNLKNYEV